MFPRRKCIQIGPLGSFKNQWRAHSFCYSCVGCGRKTNGRLKAKSLLTLSTSIHTEMTQFVPSEEEKRKAEWPLAPITGPPLNQNQNQLQKKRKKKSRHIPSPSPFRHPSTSHTRPTAKLRMRRDGVDLISCFRVQSCSFRRILFSEFLYGASSSSSHPLPTSISVCSPSDRGCRKFMRWGGKSIFPTLILIQRGRPWIGQWRKIK